MFCSLAGLKGHYMAMKQFKDFFLSFFVCLFLCPSGGVIFESMIIVFMEV